MHAARGQRRHDAVDLLAEGEAARERRRGRARVPPGALEQPVRLPVAEEAAVARPRDDVAVAVEPLVVPRPVAEAAQRVGEVQREISAEPLERGDVPSD